MIVVWNYHNGDHYGFPDLNAYKKFAVENEGVDSHTCWEDQVYDVGEQGGKVGEALDMHAFNCSVTDPIVEAHNEDARLARNLEPLAKSRWNANADKYNAWDELSEDERKDLILAEIDIYRNNAKL